jgi:DNA helicase-2/ATP-dependent DNA helicase PcrA
VSQLSQSINDLKTNPRQWDAFTTEGHCVVIAPPGSGKTKLLTTRLAYDLASKIPKPHGAACITLTNAAADELRRRVEMLGVEDRPNLFVGTVHSFALRKVIEPFSGVVDRPELAHISIASERQCAQAYDEAMREVLGPYGDTRNVRSTIDFNRQRLATDEDWAKSGDLIWGIARRYELKLRAQGLFDFLDVVAIAVQLVEHHKVIRRVLTAQYHHLYVDEYQDLAPGLDRLVRALCFDYVLNSDLFAVGDPDQALYAFTGTRPELLPELAKRAEVTSVELDHNYRCGENIIRIANLLRQGKAPMTGDRDGGHVSATRCPGGLADQYRHVVQRVRAARERDVPLHEIAVLCPLNAQCEAVTTALRTAQIPARVRGSEYRFTMITAFVEGCAAWATLGHETSNYRLATLLRRWRIALGPQWSREADITLTRLLLDYGLRRTEPAHHLLNDLLDHGLQTAISQVALADDAVEVRRMASALHSGALRSLSVRDLAERARRVDRVEVTTMTSSKGLEFDIVMLVGVDEDSIPYYLSVNDSAKLAEDRRKFYVSVTRARDELRAFYSGFVMTPYGRRIDKGPSRFLRDVGLV